MEKKYYMGIDVGSTTIKIYITDQDDNCIYSKYERHYSDIQATIKTLINDVKEQFGNLEVTAVMTGSGGLSLSSCLDVKFVQEVIACTKTIETYIPECDVAIELGGEDAKITYFQGSLEQRMNGTCAGGTGAFIDQMASLLQTDAGGLNELAKNYQMIYPIASRCGVFAKTDVQPLINEGANKEDIAISIFQAVVNQTISGLACGKPIRGKVAFLTMSYNNSCQSLSYKQYLPYSDDNSQSLPQDHNHYAKHFYFPYTINLYKNPETPFSHSSLLSAKHLQLHLRKNSLVILLFFSYFSPFPHATRMDTNIS